MIELLVLIAVAVAAYKLGVYVTAWQLRHLVYKEAKELGILSKEEEELLKPLEKSKAKPNSVVPAIVKLRIEKASDMLYLYDYDKDSFVCQAATVEELAKLAFQYNNIKYAAVVMDDKGYVFVDGQVKVST